jgi:hypothetical protein
VAMPSGGATGSGSGRTCPQCGAGVDDSAARFCPRCGYYVQWSVEADDPPTEETELPRRQDPPRQSQSDQPTETWPPRRSTPPDHSDTSPDLRYEPSAAPPHPPAAPPHPPAAPPSQPPPPREAVSPHSDLERPCPSCGTGNPPDRTWCQRCGERLAEPDPGPHVPPPPPPPQRSRFGVVVASAAVVLAAVLLVLYLLRDTSEVDPVADESPEAEDAAPVRVDPTSVTASASSELDPVPDRDLTYFASNTLDGDPETAWNHDGSRGTGAGERLTFEFAEPVEVVGLVIVNGYAKSAEVFEQNGRVRDALLISDSATVEVTLEDHAESQEIALDVGTTSSLTIEVVAVYPGTTFPDLAVTAVEFLARP